MLNVRAWWKRSNQQLITDTRYFSENPEKGFLGEEKVTRVYVVDPSTGQSGHVVYLRDTDTVQLRVGSAQFAAPASGLGTWAEEQGFLLQWHSALVAV
jgi:hypothetical protein